MRYIHENELTLFLIENKKEILEDIGLNDFENTKNMYHDFMDLFEDAKKEFITRKTIEFLVFELNLDYNNLKEVVDFELLRKVWEL